MKNKIQFSVLVFFVLLIIASIYGFTQNKKDRIHKTIEVRPENNDLTYSKQGEVVTFKEITNPVKSIHFLPLSNEFIRITSKELSSEIIKEGHYAELESKRFKEEIVFSDGEIINLPDGENILAFNGNRFLTTKVNWNTYQKTVHSYELINRKTNLIGQTVTGVENQVFLLNNGNILITDEYELAGSIMQLFNEKLGLIKEIEPLGEDGFQSSLFVDGKDYLHLLVQPTSNDKLILLTVDALKGNITQEMELPLSGISPQVFISGIKISIISGDGKMIAINKQGAVIWNVNITLPSLKFVLSEDEQKIIGENNEGIFCLSSETGKVLWNKRFNEFYNDPLVEHSPEFPSEIKIIKRLLAFKNVSDSKIAIVLGQTNPGIMLPVYPKFYPRFILMDLDGKILKNDSIAEKANLIEISEAKNSILVATEKNLITYERK